MKVYDPSMTVEERIEMIRASLKEGWSTHVSFRKAKVSTGESSFFREKLATEIDNYNKSLYKNCGVRIRTK